MSYLDTATPEALFVLSAIAQYTGASIAVLLFDEVEPQTVAWFRVIGAALAVLAVSRSGWRHWTGRQLMAAAVFGIATALMNLFFYLGIDRLDLGKSVAIEFIGPIAVAAAMTRTTRNGVALGFAVGGVLVLGGVEVDDNAVGLLFILIASAMWAAYIVVGSHVAQFGAGLTGPRHRPRHRCRGDRPGRCTVEWARLVVGAPAPAVPAGRRVLQRDRLRHRPARHAAHPGAAVLVAPRPAPRDRRGGRLARPRPTAVGIDLFGIGLVLVGVAMQERDQLAVELEPG